MLVKDGIDKVKVKAYWKGKPVDFPEISNCVHCFWKLFETLCVQSILEPAKIQWAAEKELLGKGTWINGMTYDKIIQYAKENYTLEMALNLGSNEKSCSSGSCTD